MNIVDKEEQQCRQLMAGLDKVTSDLDKQEKAIYSRVRPPLEQTRPLQDSADRLQDVKVVHRFSPFSAQRVWSGRDAFPPLLFSCPI